MLWLLKNNRTTAFCSPRLPIIKNYSQSTINCWQTGTNYSLFLFLPSSRFLSANIQPTAARWERVGKEGAWTMGKKDETLGELFQDLSQALRRAAEPAAWSRASPQGEDCFPHLEGSFRVSRVSGFLGFASFQERQFYHLLRWRTFTLWDLGLKVPCLS